MTLRKTSQNKRGVKNGDETPGRHEMGKRGKVEEGNEKRIKSGNEESKNKTKENS